MTKGLSPMLWSQLSPFVKGNFVYGDFSIHFICHLNCLFTYFIHLRCLPVPEINVCWKLRFIVYVNVVLKQYYQITKLRVKLKH